MPILYSTPFRAANVAEFECISSKSFWTLICWTDDSFLRRVLLFYSLKFILIDLYFLFFKRFYLFQTERESTSGGGGGQRQRERENLKQVPCPVQSPTPDARCGA